MTFLCSSCGACCRVAAQKGLVPDKGDGTCVHLNSKNECNIYEYRPEICRVANRGIEHYINSTLACHKLIDMFGLDDNYKIDIAEYGKDI